jgi:polysaccharide biosynthesis protein PslG
VASRHPHSTLRRGVLCALALLAAGAVPAHATVVKPPEFFGLNAQNVFKLPGGQWDRHLAAIARTGVAEVRRDAFWSQVEPKAPVGGVHSYSWSALDTIASALARNGLRWYPIVDYATDWAGSVDGSLRWKSAPRNPADYAAYAAAFARRYGTGGSFWSAHPSLPQLPVRSYEIWNEPNLAAFWPDVAGAGDRYADLLAATLPALRAADPAGKVVVGGLSPTNLTTFLDRVEARRPGLIAKTDAVAFHPYGTTWTDTGSRIRTLRSWLDAHGAAALPIEISETGWATPPLPEDTRATRMSVLVAGLATSSCAISRFIAFTWLTPDQDTSDSNDYFGIARRDTSLKPTGLAFANAVSAVEHGTEVAPADPCAGRLAG